MYRGTYWSSEGAQGGAGDFFGCCAFYFRCKILDHQFFFPPPNSLNDFKVPVLSGLGLDEVDKWWASHHKGVLMQLGGFAADVLVGGQGA